MISGSLTPNLFDLRWEKSSEIWYQLHVQIVSQTQRLEKPKSWSSENCNFFSKSNFGMRSSTKYFHTAKVKPLTKFQEAGAIASYQKWLQKKLFKKCHFHLFFQVFSKISVKNWNSAWILLSHFILRKKSSHLMYTYVVFDSSICPKNR